MRNKARDIPKLAMISIIFGRQSTTAGWILFGFLMIFAWAIGGNADTSFVHFRGETQFTKGHVIEVVKTSTSVNEKPVWLNVYEYHDAFGNEYVRDAFTTGTVLTVSEEVTVEYPVNSAQYGRIPGIRSGVLSDWLLLTWGLPLIGLFLVYIGIRRGVGDYKLLKTGDMANAKLISKESTLITVNGQPVFKLTFEYKTDYGKLYRKVVKSNRTDQLEDDEFEQILYNTRNPGSASFLGDMPGSPKLDKYGDLTRISAFPVKAILVPLIFVTPHIWFFTTI